MAARLPRPSFPNSRQLRECPFPGNHSVQCADAFNFLVIDHRVPVELSPTQYRIFQRLLDEGGRVVTDEELERLTSNFDRHIEDLRDRLKNSGITVIRAVKYGYLVGEEKKELDGLE